MELVKHEGVRLALALLGTTALLGVAQALPPFGMFFFWIGFFLIMKPILRLKTWLHAVTGGAISSALYFLVRGYTG